MHVCARVRDHHLDVLIGVSAEVQKAEAPEEQPNGAVDLSRLCAETLAKCVREGEAHLHTHKLDEPRGEAQIEASVVAPLRAVEVALRDGLAWCWVALTTPTLRSTCPPS